MTESRGLHSPADGLTPQIQVYEIGRGGMIKSVSIVSIPGRDQSKVLEFYTKKLGFKF